MSMKHTPGPWRAFPMEKHALKGFVIDTDFGNKAENDYVIADHIFGKNAAANANLIAAAPALYAELESAALVFRMLSEVAEEVRLEGAPELLASAERAEAILAKARGELLSDDLGGRG